MIKRHRCQGKLANAYTVKPSSGIIPAESEKEAPVSDLGKSETHGEIEGFSSLHHPLKAILFMGGPYQNVSFAFFWDPTWNVKLFAERPPGVVFVGRVFKIPSKCKLTFSRPSKHLEKCSLHFGYVRPPLFSQWWCQQIISNGGSSEDFSVGEPRSRWVGEKAAVSTGNCGFSPFNCTWIYLVHSSSQLG